jgi:hypothetical protein
MCFLIHYVACRLSVTAGSLVDAMPPSYLYQVMEGPLNDDNQIRPCF